MPNEPQTSQVVYTNKAHCRDCYRCLRVCPVKAIRMENGQAYVVPERCISCGTCIRECPQGAKQFRNDIDRAVRLIASGATVAASIAPSFVAIFSEPERKRLASALRKLGFAYVGETAIGAYHVAAETAKIVNSQPDRSHLCTACPAVVSYVERYEPDKVDLLVPVVSPMLAHAKHIKDKLGRGTKVVFIGPCIAKKAEASRSENAGMVDCVLTFTELVEWLEREGINLQMCEESHFDEVPEGDARFFPVVGGSMRTASLHTDLLAAGAVSVSGFNEVKEALMGSGSDGAPTIVEPLFCSQGCVNGPAAPGKGSLYERRREVLDYASANKGIDPEPESAPADLKTRFRPTEAQDTSDISEEMIREVLEKTGKSAPENQLNCGACGYASCRDKAIAVIQGMAELEMCIPYMRRLAEQRTDRIIETSPNGIVILDDRLNIISMNPAFRNFFMCSEAVCGRPISYLMDPHPFEQLAAGKTDRLEAVVRHERYNLMCHQIMYALREEKQYVGILVNITKSRAHKEKLDHLRSQTVAQARELLDHQVHIAQTIAKFVGESTAQGEALLDKLIVLAGDESGESDR
ncbi:4Fe-4S dicluster domain-containing protein, partial [bacterium]|nr:4Fe-4S dicluster domain-containing protein [bacterium]